MDDNNFSVEDGLAGDIQRAGNHGKPLRPVQPVAGEHLLFPLVEVDLDPVAVELDFVKPLVAGRRLGLQRGQLRLDDSRHCRRGGRRNNSTPTENRIISIRTSRVEEFAELSVSDRGPAIFGN